MNNRSVPFTLLRQLLFLLLMATGLMSLATRANEKEDQSADATTEKAGKDAEDDSKTEEAEIKDAFPFSFDDVSQNLVIIECKSSAGSSAGSGFIARMNGKTYIFTNQHVILGAGKIDLKNVDGEKIKAKKVELSMERDIARILIDDRADALEIGSDIGMGMPLAIFGNSEGAGVATELYGKVTGVGAELLEVTAEFVSGNSGSPVLNSNKEVIGIASYVRFSQPSRMTENTRFENKTRRFCYRIDNTKWVSVRWRQFNAAYGTAYRETEARWNSLVEIINSLYEEPFGTVPDDWNDAELKSWANSHNRTGRSNKALGSSAEALSAYCARRGRELEKLLEKRNLTEFLRDEFEGYVQAYNYASRSIDYFGTKASSYR